MYILECAKSLPSLYFIELLISVGYILTVCLENMYNYAVELCGMSMLLNHMSLHNN